MTIVSLSPVVSELQQQSYIFRDQLRATYPSLKLPNKSKWLSEIARSLGFKDWGTLKHLSHDKPDTPSNKPLNANSINLIASHIYAVLQYEIELDVLELMLKDISLSSDKDYIFAATNRIVDILRKAGRTPKVKVHNEPSRSNTLYVSDKLNLKIKQPSENITSVEFLDVTYGDEHPVIGSFISGQIEEVIEKVSNYILYQEQAFVFYDPKTKRLGNLEVFDFEWSPLIGTEQFYVNGHLAENELLDAVRKWTGNNLADWEQRHVMVHQLWEDHYDPTPIENDDIPPMCVCSFMLQTPDKHHMKRFPSITSYPATVICHKSLPSIEDVKNKGVTCDYWCNRYASWFKEANIQPYELLYDEDRLLSGFTLVGQQASHTVESMLEWPTDNFELALDNIQKWKQQGATDLQLHNSDLVISVEKLDAQTVTRIRRYVAIAGNADYCFSSLFLDNWDADFFL